MAFKMRGFSGFKQYADKNVSVDKVSDDGRTFTGTDSKGNTAEFLTNAYDPEIAQSDSVGVTGNAVSNMQMEFDQVKGTEYEEGFIKHHGKGDKPGTGKSPAKQKAELHKFDTKGLPSKEQLKANRDSSIAANIAVNSAKSAAALTPVIPVV